MSPGVHTLIQVQTHVKLLAQYGLNPLTQGDTMRPIEDSIFDLILGRMPWPASEIDLIGIPGINEAFPTGEEPSSQKNVGPVSEASASQRLAAMTDGEFRAFKDQVARGKGRVLEPPPATQSTPANQPFIDGPRNSNPANFHPSPQEPIMDPIDKAALAYALGLDEYGLWWTDDARNLLDHPKGIIEGAGQVVTSLPGCFFGGMESIKCAIDCVALSSSFDLEAFHDYITEGFEEKAAEWDFLFYEPRTKGANLVGLALSAPTQVLSDAGKGLSGLGAFEDSPNMRGALRMAGDFGGGLALGKFLEAGIHRKPPPSWGTVENANLVKQFKEAQRQIPSIGVKEKLKRQFSPARKFPERDLLGLYKNLTESSPSLLDILSPEDLSLHWDRMNYLEKHILSNSTITMVNGRPVAFLKGTRIDPLKQNIQGVSNYKLMQGGRPPVSVNQHGIQLHHGGQMNDGVIFPLFKKPHRTIPSQKGGQKIQRNAFGKYRSVFWEQGGKNYDP